ncbi:lipopolysaccharide kinase InaA family protein [Psychroflexus aestuariivivens]|uniref:lipopolysaccharide kinase InaA family protein n=1 Tax=Psychroflexus aestuariivivens TaxID=1795040 RepID=UPI000FD93915|nr:lipopolysaccharide kinase InaA family protein [Psychroflexus aestuariivivens]
MNSIFNPDYLKYKTELQNLILNFESVGTVFGNGDRNVIKTIEFKGQLLNIKSFKEPNLINKIAYKYFRKSKAKRSFEYAQILNSKNIGTPKPVAYFEFFSGLGFSKSFYISLHQDCDLTYRELVHQPDLPRHEEILRAFTRFTYGLHENEVEFLDHSPGNTLITLNSDQIEFSLVDLNRMNFRTLDFEKRMYNFRRLTSKREMVLVMSDEYAKLINKPKSEVFEKMWFYTQEFQRKFKKKKAMKKKIKFWK